MASSNQTTDPIGRFGSLSRLRDRARGNAPMPAPGGRLAQASSTAVSPNAGEKPVNATFERLRELRSKYVNQPIQNAAGTLLGPVMDLADKIPLPERPADLPPGMGLFGGGMLAPGSDPRTLKDVAENAAYGAGLGSLVLPDDLTVEPSNPMPALQMVSMVIAAGAEGIVTDMGILHGLNAVQKAATLRGATNLARSAERALDLYGQGADVSKMRQAMGSVALAGTSEVGLNVAGLQDPEDILANTAMVTGGVAATTRIGAAVAAVNRGVRRTAATPGALISFAEGFAKGAAPEISGTLARGADADQIAARITQNVADEQAAFRIAAREGYDEQGFKPFSSYIERLDEAARVMRASRALGNKGQLWSRELLSRDVGRTGDAEIDAMFGPRNPVTLAERFSNGVEAARNKWQTHFVYEANLKRFPSIFGTPGTDLSDDMRVLAHQETRATSLAEKDLETVIAPMRRYNGKEFGRAWDAFERIVVLRDLKETAAKGFTVSKDWSMDRIDAALSHLEMQAPDEVLQAAENHRLLVNGMRDDLITRGKLSIGDGYENYFPHRVIDELAAEEARIMGMPEGQRPVSPTSRALLESKGPKQRLGSEKEIRTNYIEVMYGATKRFHADRAVDQFLEQVEKSSIPLKRADLTPDELDRLKSRGRFTRNGEVYARYTPRGPAYYRAEAANREAVEALKQIIEDGASAVNVDAIPAFRDVLAVGQPKEWLLPADLASRMEQFNAPDPLGNLGLFRKSTAWWKRNTIWWGLSRFFVFQVAGDSINLFRTNPKAFLQVRNGRMDSPVLRAANELAKASGTPVMSMEQAVGGLVGGVGGLGIAEALNSEDQSTLNKVSWVLAGAGLGYGVATARATGTRVKHSSWVDLADDLAVTGSGFSSSEEDVARRILRERTPFVGEGQTPPHRRALDSFATLFSGKAHGNPYAPFEIPARFVEGAQTNRENWLRLAHFMQQVEDGVPERLAAKRAREDLVDYGKFTDYENRVVRGFWLPFYSFTRQNIPNWIRSSVNVATSAVGKPNEAVGGALGALATASIAGMDIAAQSWNEQFFPETERGLRDYQRDRFHIIAGNPVTGEPFRTKDGRVMVLGVEMPYEQALEMFGMARPGEVYSELLGMRGADEDVSLVEKARRTPAEIASFRKGPGKIWMDLLTPIVKAPAELMANHSWFYDGPIIPPIYFGDGTVDPEALQYLTDTFFRQARIAKQSGFEGVFDPLNGMSLVERGQKFVEGARRFDPLTSALGMGMPIDYVDLQREARGYLLEEMDRVESENLRQDNKWRRAVDDILYNRNDFQKVEDGELQEVYETLDAMDLSPSDRQRAQNYYMAKGGRGSTLRRYRSLSGENRIDFLMGLDDWARTFLVIDMNGGNVADYTAPASGPTVTGN